MKLMSRALISCALFACFCFCACTSETQRVLNNTPGLIVWPNEVPEDCPFERSESIAGIAFTSRHSNYRVGDTWYPSWASDGNLYSPYTDGGCPDAEGKKVYSTSNGILSAYEDTPLIKRQATTGQAVMIGKDPIGLRLVSLGVTPADPYPYGGRYPCGSLVHNGVWYYGTYGLSPHGYIADHGYIQDGDGFFWNWPTMGPFMGFRVSQDYGKTWTLSPHSPESPLFPEPEQFEGPVKFGAPHFVDFGKNMEHSPDGKAYLVGMGAEVDDPQPRKGNLSWISGDQVYMCRVMPSIENINDESKYEYYAGVENDGKAKWSWDFEDVTPLLDWNNNMGCVTVTYNPPLKKYLMCVTDGWPTSQKMNSYVLEADRIAGPYRLAFYMKHFGEQAYFLNFPSKFISEDGRTLWLCYSGNFTHNWPGQTIVENPPGSHYGLVLQQVVLLDEKLQTQLASKTGPP